MQKFNNFLIKIDEYLGSSDWFVYLLLGTGIFFTIYLFFPQIRYFGHAIANLSGKFDKKDDIGDTTHFQAMATALSGTIGTGNIAGVALAIHIGGPSALFWMLVTAFLGMTTKFVEVILSHKYREVMEDGTIAGGPMYYMKKRLNITIKNKNIKTGVILGSVFALATIISSFGTGNMPQINNIASIMDTTFSIPKYLTGIVLSILLALIIIGGIKRIAKVTSALTPFMTLLYFIGALTVLIYNKENVIPSLKSIFTSIFDNEAATGGFLGTTFIYAFKKGVNRGLFSNEAGQGSAPIAHASAKAHEPVSEGMVAILEPFIDTIIICFLTGLTILSSGAWKEKFINTFQMTDIEIIEGKYDEKNQNDLKKLFNHINKIEKLKYFSGNLFILEGKTQNDITLLHSRSVAEDYVILNTKGQPFNGIIKVENGKIVGKNINIVGKSLLHSAPLSAMAFSKSYFKDFGKIIVAIGLLLFAFSTSISWSYYGDRAVTFLFGSKYVLIYRIFYIIGFFIASIADTTIIWSLSYITVVLMTVPNLIGLLILHKEIKETIHNYWILFHKEHPNIKLPLGVKNRLIC